MSEASPRFRSGDRPARGGFTLIEILVAVGVFVLLGAMLVGILSGAMRLWDSGEVRRDTYERAQVVFEQVTRDLANVYADPDPALPQKQTSVGAAGLPPEAYLAEADPALAFHSQPEESGSSWLACTVVEGQALGGVYFRIDPADDTGTLLRGVWEPNTPSAKLVRVEGTKEIPLRPAVPEALITSPRELASALKRSKFLEGTSSKLAAGILHFGLRFWTPTTTTWEASVRPRRNPRPGESCGSETRWDSSTRFDRQFYAFDTRARDSDPVTAMVPSLVRLEIVVEPESRRRRGTKIPDDLDTAQKEIRVDSTRDFPEPPNWFKIDDEWFHYTSRTSTSFTVDQRGARGSAPQRHKANARVRYGETFVTVVQIPCAKAR
ncbi:MAG: prepilin-type N-terminal cleavage/methylation domain-containing protein [Planctomycetes bacterium]|nr:prepilin-type N-terminal cleavage/methylation domain-containing protein [Planctomycetota bacterium]